MRTDPAIQPSPRQLEAIEADFGPVLVLAGPGAGKTLCLIERVRHLIEHRGLEPGRICAVTYTNKAAEEVAGRLRDELGERADQVARSTIHSLAVRILRDHGSSVGVERGFGIADEEYQLEVLHKLRVPPRLRRAVLSQFTLHRLCGRDLHEDDLPRFEKYRTYLARRGMVDFDDLLLFVGRLFDERPDLADDVAARFDYLLVDEFQDLNPAQYRIIHRLAQGHRNAFAVGDDEQSIFSWTGADPRIIERFANDFGIRRRIVLEENRRSGRPIFDLARKLIAGNISLFRKDLVAVRETAHPVLAMGFPDDAGETRWLIEDLVRDREASGLRWGDYALLYRRHLIGDALEAALMQAGIPCRLAQGRAVTDDPVIRYLVTALRLIAQPRDPIFGETFLRLVLPGPLMDRLHREARSRRLHFMPSARRTARELPNADEDGRKIRRALASMTNLAGLRERHTTLAGLVDEILSQRVGPYRTTLELHADELSDPANLPEAVRLADALAAGRKAHGRIMLRPMGGLEIGLAGMLNAAGFRLVDYVAPDRPPAPEDVVLEPGAAGGLGLALGTFKALQMLAAAEAGALSDFVAFDLETTDRNADTAEIVEIAAARVRGWQVTEDFHALVRPRVPIAAGATRTHGYGEAAVADAPAFEAVWPRFKDFVGADTLIAHNGNLFDFPILYRMARQAGDQADFVTYDTLPLARWLRLGSAKLQMLAERFGVDPGDPHKALSDVRTLVGVFRRLEEEKVARARRVGLANVLDHLAIALALSDPETLNDEARLLLDAGRVHALGRFTTCLDFYAGERTRVGPTAAPVDELVERLGGHALMLRVRAEKRPAERYPAAMARVRRLMEGLPGDDLDAQIEELLARVALSRSDGPATAESRVNLLTLHATKGLEFSRVYVVGAEDSELPGGAGDRGSRPAELEEARRLLYVGMTRARDRLVLTRVDARAGRPTGGSRFLEEMGLVTEPIGGDGPR